MKLIVGLGNPGSKYVNTWHNLGFMALDAVFEKIESDEKKDWEKVGKTEIVEARIAGQRVVLAKPLTYMNLSGNAVSFLLGKYKLSVDDLIVVHDDIDLPVGTIRVRFGGGAGGHKGVQSVIDRVETEKFLRIRLGIGRLVKVQNSKFKIQNLGNVENYVLGEVGPDEREKVEAMIGEVVKIVPLILKHGLEEYMGKYNKSSKFKVQSSK
ncbi:MAG: aminoacyl-tRNA hydrolase [Armatimonadetes bacterium]|nr:MAG: aminoacyl-tRNA hydrolase [Armatimonadota bacterium]